VHGELYQEVMKRLRRILALSIIVTLACVPRFSEVRAAVPLTPAGDGHDTIPAFVNGKGPFAFILDTGADGSALYQWFAEKAQLSKGKLRDVDGQTGNVSSPSYSLKSLSVDGHAIHNIVADGLPNRHDTGIEAGVAGNDLMDGTIAIFDFPCRSVELRKKPVDIYAIVSSDSVMVQGESVPDGTQLTLPVTVEGVEGTAYLDTGSRDTRISPSFAAAAHIDPSSSEFRDADLIFGFKSKGTVSRIGPIGSVQFAGITIARAQARVIALPVFGAFRPGGPPAMILGMDLMQGYRLVYDHEAKRFWFTPSSCTDARK
jgi:Aspartyl protease